MTKIVQSDISVVNSFTRRISVEVPWEDIQDDYRTFLRKFAKKVSMPGFRKGKVPAQIIRKQYGLAAEAEFAESAVQEYYLANLEKLGVDPINRATIEGVHFHEGESLRFQATFEVEPEITLPTYKKGMKVEHLIYKHEEEDVSRAIEEMRLQRATLRTVEEGAEENHFLLADLQEIDAGGMPIIGNKIENQYIQLDPDGAFGGENLKALEGARSGDVRRATLPREDGSAIHYEVTVRQVTERLLPDIDDAFAREVDTEAENVDTMNANLHKKIQAAFDRESEKQLTHELADHFVKNASVEVPTSMIDNYIDNVIADMRQQGYAEESIDRNAVEDEHKASIVWNIKWYLLRKRLLDEEEIVVDDEQVDKKIEELAATDEDQAKQVKNFYRRTENRRNLREDLLSDALFERLKDYAKIKEVRKPSSELRKAS